MLVQGNVSSNHLFSRLQLRTALHLSYLSMHLTKLQTEITQKRLRKRRFLYPAYLAPLVVQMRLTSALASCLVR